MAYDTTDVINNVIPNITIFGLKYNPESGVINTIIMANTETGIIKAGNRTCTQIIIAVKNIKLL